MTDKPAEFEFTDRYLDEQGLWFPDPSIPEIARLQAEVARLRKALEQARFALECAQAYMKRNGEHMPVIDEAAAALEGKDG